MSLIRLCLRSALSLSSPIYQLRRQVSYLPPTIRSTPTSAAYPLPIPRDPSSPPLQLPTDLVSKFDYTASTHVWSIVKVLTDLSYLDRAAEYARLVVLAVPERTRDKETKTQIAETCRRVIGGMLVEKRYEEVYELFHYFFNVNCLAPDYDCCCHVLNALSYQGRLDDAIQFYERAVYYADFQLESHALVNALINVGMIEDVYRLFFYGYGLFYPVFIHGYLAHGNIDEAKKISEHMKLRHDMYENIAKVYRFKQGKDEEAIPCVSKLAEAVNRLNTLLQVLLKYGTETEAWSLFDKLFGNIKDEETRRIMIQECIETGEISKALEIAGKEARAANSVC